MSVGNVYRQLAYDTFEPQLISDPENDEHILEVCEKLIREAGYPLGDEDDWLEYVYAANEMVAIVQEGHVYRRERDDSKPGGWDYVLYTKDNHPGFQW